MPGRSSETITFGPFRFVRGNGLWRDTTEIPLPPRALVMLETFLARPGDVIAKAELLDAGWKDAFVTEASLTEAVRALRSALGDDSREPRYIRTVHRRGYRFIAPVTVVSDPAVFRPDVPPPAAPEVRLLPSSSPDAPEWRPVVAAAAIAATVLAALAIVILASTPRRDHVGRFSIALPDDVRLDALQGTVAVSRDGSRVAFVAHGTGPPQLFVRAVDRDVPEALPGTQGASDPFFSPDGLRIGFFADGWLKTVGVEGGTPTNVTRVDVAAGAAWTGADAIVFGGGPGGGLARVSADGGEPVSLIAPAVSSPEVRFGWPDVGPDAERVLFTIVTPAGSDVGLLEAGASTHRVLIREARFARFAHDGRLVAERDGEIVASRLSPRGSTLSDALRPVMTGVATSGVLGGPRFAVSGSNSLVYVPGPISGPPSLRWVGTLQTPTAADLGRALVLDRDTASDTRVASPASPGGDRSPAIAVNPAWRPDGLEVAFALNKSGPFNLFVSPGPGGVASPLGSSPWNQTPTSWSPDGRTLLFTEFHPSTGADIWALDLPTRTRRPIVRTVADETGARYSRDGRWIAYLTRESGAWEAVVQPVSSDQPGARIAAGRLLPASLGPASNGRELRVVLGWLRQTL